MSKSNTFENDFLKLIFHGTAIANIADNAASSALTNLYIALHTGDPGESGTQSTNEVSYTGYARVAIPRSSLGWVITGDTVKPFADVVFGVPTVVSGDPVATHASVGVASSGSTKILYRMILNPGISIIVGKAPRLLANSTITED